MPETMGSHYRRDTVEPVEAASLDVLTLELELTDSDVVAELQKFPEGRERDNFAQTALRIGVLALRQARGTLDANVVEKECDRLMTVLQTRLDQHGQLLDQQLTKALRDYFDPNTGRFQERVERLIRRDGDLEQVLRRHIGQQDSELCKTLVQHVGQQSPLFKLLSPSESDGLLKSLGSTVAVQLKEQSDTVLKQFSLDNKDGALCRMVGELTAKQGQFTDQMKVKIDAVVKEFSLDEENSALSRLVKNVTTAQRTISAEFSLDNDQSALSRLKRIVEKTDEAIRGNLTLDNEHSALFRLKRELIDTLQTHSESAQKFQEEVKQTLSAIVARREEADKSTRHGMQFEEAVCEFLDRQVQPAGDVSTRTGNTTGEIRNCKVGDVVITLGPDSAAPGAKVVVEAKEDRSYDTARARAEIEQARKNRSSQVGLFVFSKKTALPTMEPVSRLGNDVLVVWDAEDATTDVFLRVALTLAKALCIREANAREAQEVDFTELDAAVLEIEKRANDLDKVNGWSETIRTNADKIIDHVRIARNALDRQLKSLREHLSDLRQTLNTSDTSGGAS